MPLRGDDFAKQINAFRKFKERAPRIIGQQAVGFFKLNFRRQGWPEGGKLERWAKRSPKSKRNKRRALLVDSGRLKRSIRVVRARFGYVEVGTDVPYAKTHNEGGRISKRVRVRAHKRVKRKESELFGQKLKSEKVMQVRAHQRNMNTTIPRRQFIGNSPDLEKSIKRALERDLKRLLGL